MATDDGDETVYPRLLAVDASGDTLWQMTPAAAPDWWALTKGGPMGCLGTCTTGVHITVNTNTAANPALGNKIHNILPPGAMNPYANPAGAYKPPSAYYPPMLSTPAECPPVAPVGQSVPDYHALATEALSLLLLSRRTYDVSDADVDAFEQRARAALYLPDEWQPTR